jgi:hypothetical protein
LHPSPLSVRISKLGKISITEEKREGMWRERGRERKGEKDRSREY